VRRPPDQFPDYIARVREFFAANDLVPFELVLVPNSNPIDRTDRAVVWCGELERRYPEIVSVQHRGPPGKGAAIRTGVSAARGRFVLFMDADLPYRLDFFPRALALLRDGYGLVVGNRRMPDSVFEVPVRLLHYVYGRHRKSLLFNRAVRALLPIASTDTQAGIKAMTREFAAAAFSLDLCPSFFFDIELFLTAAELGLPVGDLPVHFTQEADMSTVGFLVQSLNAVRWLIRIKWRHLRGFYRRVNHPRPVRPVGKALHIP
jgi:dolichyl-phosphate beta-glucosyltransferase